MRTPWFHIVSFWRQIRAYFIYRGPVLDAFFLAITLHGDQKRKYTHEPYWFHLDDVAYSLYQLGERDVNTLSAALLHDAVEDVPNFTLVHLFEFYKQTQLEYPAFGLDPVRVTSLVRDLTDVFVKIDYMHLSRSERKALERERIAAISSEAKKIKLADIASNLPSIKRHDPEFYPVFSREIQQLLPVLQNVNPILYRNISTVIES